jgi:hypothetical protein
MRQAAIDRPALSRRRAAGRVGPDARFIVCLSACSGSPFGALPTLLSAVAVAVALTALGCGSSCPSRGQGPRAAPRAYAAQFGRMCQVHQLRPRVRLHRENRRESGHRCSNRRRVRQHDRRHSLPQCRTIVLVGPLRRSNPREPFPLRLACACSASYRSGRSNASRIAAHRLISGRFRALIRISSARNDGDIRGWFDRISDPRAEPDPPA